MTLLGELLSVAPVFATYYLAALGNGFFEKSGVLNLAIDGVFVLTATVAFAFAVYTGNPLVGAVIASLVGAFFGAFIAYLATRLPVSHGALGLSLMFLGYGLSLLIGIPALNYVFAENINVSAYTIPLEPPVEAGLIAVCLALGTALLLVLTKTKLGAAVRAAGEDPYAASALGVDVLRVRIIAGIIGYALIGLGSAIFTLAWRGGWDPKIYLLGHGWIAFAISLSGGRHPLFMVIMALAFSWLVRYQYVVQTTLKLTTEVANMLPYIAAITAMAVFHATPLKQKLAPPASLGKPFYKEERTV